MSGQDSRGQDSRGQDERRQGAGRVLRIALVAAAVLAIGVACLAWAFLVYDLGSGYRPGRAVKLLWLAILGVPVLAALGVLAWRSVRGNGSRGRSFPRLAAAVLGGMLALGVIGFTAATDARQPDGGGAFYDPSGLDLEVAAGTLLRHEPMDGAPEGSTAYRILFRSTRLDGMPSAVSGTLVVPASPAPEGGRPVVVFTHGTVGIAPNCAPSLREHWTHLIDGLELFLERGFAVVAPDYEGMGVEGDHPYLVGDVAAMNALDAVRAARQLPEAGAGATFASWGASQGGHASLFTGELAASYAPELELAGVVAAAPPTDLGALFDLNLGTPFGNVLGAFAFLAWSEVYPEAELGQIVTPLGRPLVRHLAGYCFLEPKQSLSVMPGAMLLDVSFVRAAPSEVEPWAGLLERNSPGARPIGRPVLIAQGEADRLVRPEITSAFVAERCAAGETIEYRTYPGLGHVPAGPTLALEVAEWLAARFAGEPLEDSCG